MSAPGGFRLPLKQPLGSVSVRAALVFGALNLVLVIANWLPSIPAEQLPTAHTWEWWRTRQYLSLSRAPDVVLLGSSLMMIPTSMTEADYLKTDIDVASHYRSQFLEQCLNPIVATGEAAVRCFNFSLPGAMVSDDYMIERALMQGAQKPRLVVVGLTVRDFIDAHCPCAAATPTFQYLRRFTAVDDLDSIAMPEFWQRLQYWHSDRFFMLAKKPELQFVFSRMVASAVTSIAGPERQSPAGLFSAERRREEPAKPAGVVERLRGAQARAFVIKPHEPWLFEDNRNEYRKRFGRGNERLFECQAEFLQRLLALSQTQGIRVLVVNMPLTAANIDLMPRGYYERYLETAANACTKYGADWLDLQGTFALNDFKDTAHMNAGGGKKLLERIASTIRDRAQLRTALAPAPDNVPSAKIAAVGRSL